MVALRRRREGGSDVALYRDWATQGLFHERPWIRVAAIIGLCAAVALPVGAAIGGVGWLYGGAALGALVLGYLMLRSLLLGLVAFIGLICLLPFAALPINVGFSPTFLDLAFGALFFVWLSRIATHKDDAFLTDPPTVGVLSFVALAIAAFIAGLAHAPLTANVVRRFAEILLSLLIFLLVINAVRTEQHLRVLVLALIVAGALAALVGIVLYYLPQHLSIRLLSTLRIVRYPAESDVLRYIEDDPNNPLRATSTSIDPNVLGGMLIFVTTLAATQFVAARPILPRFPLGIMLGLMFLCMILTYSRSSFAGLMAAIGLLGLIRYRRLLWIGLLTVAFLLLLPPAQAYVQHFIDGLTSTDLATQMRWGEYKDAATLIGRHPWLGVGFAGTPEIDTYLGVSSVYLLIAEEMGLLGLAAFIATLVSFLWRSFSAYRRCPRDSTLEPLLLGTSLAVVGAMTGGILDHYLFNLSFPHASSLLWLMVGLGAVSVRLARQQSGAQM